MKRWISAGCTLALVLLAPPPLRADFLLTGAGAGPLGNFGQETGTAGYGFTVGSSPLQVITLGVWDLGADGLTNTHQVGLWTNSGTLLAMVEVPSGTGGTLQGEFRYANLSSPVTLTAHETYVLGASYSSRDDPFRLENNTT